MNIVRHAKILVELPSTCYEIYNCYEKDFVGTEAEILAEAHDWCELIALEYIHKNCVTDEQEQLRIINGVTHQITWEDNTWMA